MAAEQRPVFSPLSEEAYRIIEAESTEKHEFVNGQIYAMAGGSPTHNDLAGSAYAALYNQLRGKPCVPRGSDQRVKVVKTGINTYPDIVVACPPLTYDGDGMTLLDAAVIIEVLSPSTERYDAGAKFLHYTQMPSLQHYILISQDRIQVEHRRRREDHWSTEIFTQREDTVTLDAITCTLNLAELYERVDVPSAMDIAPPDEK